jgi:hypothetical protein
VQKKTILFGIKDPDLRLCGLILHFRGASGVKPKSLITKSKILYDNNSVITKFKKAQRADILVDNQTEKFKSPIGATV